MGSDTYDSQKPLHGKYFNFAFINSAASPRRPRLELLRGPPTQCGSSPRNPQSFRLLPLAVSAGGDPVSPDGPSTCLWNAEVAFQEGKSHGLFLNIHTCENPLPWQCLTTKCEIGGSIFWRTPRSQVQGAVTTTLLNDLGSPLSGMWERSKTPLKECYF